MQTRLTTEEALAQLRGVKKVKDGWMALCPAHDDHNPSLSITEKPDGKFLMKCHEGCSFEAVLDALAITSSNRTDVPEYGVRRLDVALSSAKQPVSAVMTECFTGKQSGVEPPHSKIVDTYSYTDMNFDEIFQIVRLEPKSFRARRPDGNGGWIWNLEGVELVPYQVLDVEAVSRLGETVYIVEGEKDVDTMRSLLGFRDECDNSQISMTLGKWESALHGKTRIYTHHQRKGGGDHGEAIAGGGGFLGCVDRAIEIRFDEHSKNRRKLVVHSRLLEAPDLLLEMNDDGLQALGTPEGVTLANVQVRAYDVLGNEWLSIKEIEALIGQPSPSRMQTREALNNLYANGEIERNPAETKSGATYRYRRIIDSELTPGRLALE